MVCCSAYGCSNRSDRRRTGLTFHRFPKNDAQKAAWVKAVRRKDWSPGKASVLCSEHFRADDFDRTSLCYVRLRDGVVPSIFASFPSYLSPKVSKRQGPTKRRAEDAEGQNKRKLVEEETVICAPASPEQHENDTIVTEPVQPVIFCHGVDCCEKAIQLRMELKRMTKLYQGARRKIKVLQQTKRRHRKANKKLANLVGNLEKKNLMDEGSLDILKNIPGFSRFLIQRLISSGEERYEPELRAFALTLHFYSPKAYRYVRDHFNTCLPHPRTISKWYGSVDGNPGITLEAIKTLKSRVDSCTYPIFVNIVIDEMAIRQHVEWDGQRYHGYVDYGHDFNNDSMPVAKEVLVVMAVGINDKWKLPVAYYFTNGVSGEQRANIVTQALIEIHGTGVNISSLTFDGAASNMAMANVLGCQLTPQNMVTHFQYPVTRSPVYVFLDPSHMLKLVRNTLGDKRLLRDGEEGEIDWKFLETLKNLQDMEGVHLGNKLRAAHMDWRRQKMKVRLAAQVLSDSVADALAFCEELELPEFQGSAPLCLFLKVFNRLFDILNSRNTLQRGWKKPIHVGNIEDVKQFLEQAKQYILKLRDATGKLVVQSNRKMGFIGFLVCISSTLGLYQSLLKEDNNVVRYLPTYRISQDHLEIFFSSIRSQGGFNNNPTARQFRAAYKKLIIHCQVAGNARGNCIPMQNIPILHASSASENSSVSTINQSTDLADVNISDPTPLDHSYFPVPHPVELTEVTKNVVAYIAGFVARKLKRTLKCSICSPLLTGENTGGQLLQKKDRGGLTQPSPDVIKICRICEKIVRVAIRTCTPKLLALVVRAQEQCGAANIFPELKEHSLNQEPEENHQIHLVRAVSIAYFQIRLAHHAKCATESMQKGKIRQIFT